MRPTVQETADVVLVKSNPNDVVALIDLSKKTCRKTVQNLWWATGYNIFAISLAAGILAPCLGRVSIRVL
ncbi:hypothetical protein [Planococcus sp. ISL-110]|uniref:hypothetical protein n=1 Tax=Planococcus sp. ISL-110 TaxID=2819167 RepID=UPI00203636F4|nr:hypothetical protein [Planococcus sp. ISL-110]